jgi:transposase
MEQQVDSVAGLDVHRDSVVACARLGRGERPKVMKKSFKTTTAGVDELARWLADFEVNRVVMESTGVYWKPVVRHEALFDRAEMKGLRLQAVAAAC